jgi:glyceraldehyde 3-phosphate dehydrogenase
MTVGGSIVDAVFEMKRNITVNEINELMKKYSNDGNLVGILGYEERPLVSTDYNNERRSGVVDAGSTMVIHNTMLKMYVWYDNEWGYSCRMVDLIKMVVDQGI